MGLSRDLDEKDSSMAELPPQEFVRFLQTALPAVAQPSVLEIGGGASTNVELPGARYTVVDNSKEALARCAYADEAVLADAERFDPQPGGYDVVVFWNVLEHLANPDEALRRAAAGVRSNGLLIARGPELRSLKALITRLTPHRLHVLFYRKVLGSPEAGSPGRSPFPVHHSSFATPEAIMATLLPLGFSVAHDQRYVGDQLQLLRSYSTLAYFFYQLATGLLRIATGGRWGGPSTDFVMVFRKAR